MDDASTPLETEEQEQLIPNNLTTRADLDRAEHSNIIRAEEWAFSLKGDALGVLEVGFLNQLHKRMFGDVWQWAGMHRHTPSARFTPLATLRLIVRSVMYL